jgi:hypothetical protein
VEPVTRRPWLLAGVVAAIACSDSVGPGRPLSLVIVPAIVQQGLDLVSGDMDELHIRIARLPEPPGAIVFDDTVKVDTAGNADLMVKVPLSAATERFEVLLEGVRSSDRMVLYTGRDTATVSNLAAAASVVTVPVSYVGPCGALSGCTVTVAPQDSIATQGTSLAMRITVDSAGKTISGVPIGITNLTPALVSVTRDGRVTALLGTPGGAARVIVATTGAVDTLRLTVPRAVVVTPSYATLTLAPPGNVIALSAGITGASWGTSSPAVATVSSNGLVTAVGRGTVVIGASLGNAMDSALVAVRDTGVLGDVVALALAGGGESFATTRVGKSVAIDVVVDLKGIPTELLGSYAARFSWNATTLKFDSSAAGTGFFTPQPTVTVDTTAVGVLQLGDVNPTGAGGVQTLVRLWFTAAAVGVSANALQIDQMTSVVTGIDFAKTNRVVVGSGGVTIEP